MSNAVDAQVSRAHPHALVVGGFRNETLRRIQEGAAAASVAVETVDLCEDLPAALGGAAPFAIVLRVDAAGAADACIQVRSSPRFADVPIFGVAPERNDLALTELFGWGGDDLVGVGSPHPIARRLRALKTRAAPVTARSSGPTDQAIVAGSDSAWRSAIGRALYNGGFAVRFASTALGLVEESLGESVRVVVASEDLAPDGAVRALTESRVRGGKTAWVLVVAPKRMADAIDSVDAFDRVSVVDSFAPPENTLFTINELLAPRGVDNRSSPRLLYGTSVAFRIAGRAEDDIGFSYNVSADGVFVRTLDPLEPSQEVWLEMWPPRCERRVRLEGTVAWRRAFGPNGGATVPAGFGLRITGGLPGDVERWRSGCKLFEDSLHHRHLD
jgi:hypothetical protein